MLVTNPQGEFTGLSQSSRHGQPRSRRDSQNENDDCPSGFHRLFAYVENSSACSPRRLEQPSVIMSTRGHRVGHKSKARNWIGRQRPSQDTTTHTKKNTSEANKSINIVVSWRCGSAVTQPRRHSRNASWASSRSFVNTFQPYLGLNRPIPIPLL